MELFVLRKSYCLLSHLETLEIHTRKMYTEEHKNYFKMEVTL